MNSTFSSQAELKLFIQNLTNGSSDTTINSILNQLSHEVQLPHEVQLSHEVQLPHEVQLSHEVQLPHEVQLSHEVQLPHDVQFLHEVQFPHEVQLSHEVQLPPEAQLPHKVQTIFQNKDIEDSCQKNVPYQKGQYNYSTGVQMPSTNTHPQNEMIREDHCASFSGHLNSDVLNAGILGIGSYAILIPRRNMLKDHNNKFELKTTLAKLVASVLKPSEYTNPCMSKLNQMQATQNFHYSSENASYDVRHQLSYLRGSKHRNGPYPDTLAPNLSTLSSTKSSFSIKGKSRRNGEHPCRMSDGTQKRIPRNAFVDEQNLLNDCLSQAGGKLLFPFSSNIFLCAIFCTIIITYIIL